MTKKGLFATSLVAALPALALAGLMLMAILNHMEGMPTILMVCAITMFAMAAAVTLFPMYILGFYGRVSTPKTPKKAKDAKDDKNAKAAEPKTLVAPKKGKDEVEEASEDEFEPAGDFEDAAEDNFEFEDFADEDKDK